MNWCRLISFFILSSFFITGCPSSDTASSTRVRERLVCEDGVFKSANTGAIVGGTAVDPNDWVARANVFIQMKFKDKSGNIYGAACTAILIDRDVLLSAGHCFTAEEHGESFVEARAVFAAQPECNNNAQLPKEFIRISQVAVHPNYNTTPGGLMFANEQNGDLAMVKLERSAPTWARTVKLSATQPELDDVDSLIFAVGYGRTEPKIDMPEYNARVLRAAFLRPIQQSTKTKNSTVIKQRYQSILQQHQSEMAASVVLKVNQFLANPDVFSMGENMDYLYTDQTAGLGICSGDSGGAAFYKRNGLYYVVGIASFVANYVNEPESGTCGGFGAYTSTFRYQLWITETYNKLRNPNTSAVNLFE